MMLPTRKVDTSRRARKQLIILIINIAPDMRPVKSDMLSYGSGAGGRLAALKTAYQRVLLGSDGRVPAVSPLELAARRREGRVRQGGGRESDSSCARRCLSSTPMSAISPSSALGNVSTCPGKTTMTLGPDRGVGGQRVAKSLR